MVGIGLDGRKSLKALILRAPLCGANNQNLSPRATDGGVSQAVINGQPALQLKSYQGQQCIAFSIEQRQKQQII